MTLSNWLRPRDARGRESRTLSFVIVAFSLMTLRFVLGGLDFDFGAFHYAVASTHMVDYGAAVAAVIAVWVGREWVDAKREGQSDV